MSPKSFKTCLLDYKVQSQRDGNTVFSDSNFNSDEWTKFISQNNLLIKGITKNNPFSGYEDDLIDYIVGFISFHDRLGKDFSPLDLKEFNQLKKTIINSYSELHNLIDKSNFDLRRIDIDITDECLSSEELVDTTNESETFVSILIKTKNNLKLLSESISNSQCAFQNKKRGYQYNSLNNKKAVFFFQKYYLNTKNALNVDHDELLSFGHSNLYYNLSPMHYRNSTLKDLDDFKNINTACELTANAMALLKIAPSSIGGDKITTIQIFEAALNPKIDIGRGTVEYVKNIRKNGFKELLFDELNVWRNFITDGNDNDDNNITY